MPGLVPGIQVGPVIPGRVSANPESGDELNNIEIPGSLAVASTPE